MAQTLSRFVPTTAGNNGGGGANTTQQIQQMQASPSQSSTQHKDSMKSYLSNNTIHNATGLNPPSSLALGLNVAASHQALLTSSNGGATPLVLPQSHQRSGILGNKMIQDSVRKTDHHHPAYSSSPKNIIVKTNKFLFKNIAPEPQRAPKGDLGITQQQPHLMSSQNSIHEKKSIQMIPTKLSQKNLRQTTNLYSSPYHSQANLQPPSLPMSKKGSPDMSANKGGGLQIKDRVGATAAASAAALDQQKRATQVIHFLKRKDSQDRQHAAIKMNKNSTSSGQAS